MADQGDGMEEGPGKHEPGDDTEDLELGEDLGDDLEHEELDDEIISAETAEWSLDEDELEEDEEDEEEDDEEDEEEQDEEEEEEEEEELEAPAGAEPTLVAAAEGDGGGLRSVRSALGAPFRWVGHLGFPLWARFLMASLVIVTSMAAATSTAILLYVSDIADALGHGGAFKDLENYLDPPNPGEPQTMLVIGSDLQPVGASKNFQGLSDTTMLIRLDPERDAIALFSLPRDLKVDIPGYGTAKLNEAYTAGGPKLTLRTVRQLTQSPERPHGLEVNHLVNVDFTGFARAVNAINCVYVDVDRRYYHSNDETVADYDEINLQPGYQALCGFDALDFARYRHTDNDVVRAARQQDFLREARQKVPVSRLIQDRKDLIEIFTEHTTSDIDSWPVMLDVFKLFVASRDAAIKEVHFEGTLGPSFVTATQAQINQAVDQFLGIKDTPGARAKTAKPTEPVAPEDGGGGSNAGAPAAKAAKRKQKQSLGSLDEAGLVPTDYGRVLARGIRRRGARSELPIYYPTILEAGSDYEQKPRVYKINGTGHGSPPDGERHAYKWVFSRPALGDYYGFMGTRWENPTILSHPSEERTVGDRTYEFFYDGDRLRIVAWQTDCGSFWLSNTLIQSLSEREMVEIARGMRELETPGG
jgi:LCP family protein required for cell wall assembly